MGLTASLPEIDKLSDTVFVVHEKSEKHIPLHQHTKDQLSYVEGGVAYVTVGYETYVVPARHYLWIPKHLPHTLKVSHSATVFFSLFFYSETNSPHEFYHKLGIYPANELIIQMINYTERWDGQHVDKTDENFEFLISLKKILPTLNQNSLSIILPTTNDSRLLQITKYLENNIDKPICLSEMGIRFNMSERSISRLFRHNMNVSFFQYLKILRMVHAIELILKTNKTLSEIAFSVGYETLGAFSNTFHEFTKIRPSDLRKNTSS